MCGGDCVTNFYGICDDTVPEVEVSPFKVGLVDVEVVEFAVVGEGECVPGVCPVVLEVGVHCWVLVIVLR